VAGNPGHPSSQGAAFYAKDFTRNISVRTVSGRRHGAEHRFSYAEPGNAKHHHREFPEHNRNKLDRNKLDRNKLDRNKLDRNKLKSNRNYINDRDGFHGYAANLPARKHHHWQPSDDPGNTGCCRQRRIRNRWNTRNHGEPNWNVHYGGAVHALQQRQHWNVNDGEQHAFDVYNFK
jgi:hypothetical protein